MGFTHGRADQPVTANQIIVLLALEEDGPATPPELYKRIGRYVLSGRPAGLLEMLYHLHGRGLVDRGPRGGGLWKNSRKYQITPAGMVIVSEFCDAFVRVWGAVPCRKRA